MSTIHLHPISLKAAGDGCELVFTHALLPDPVTATGHEKGWNGSLDKLERHLARRLLRL